MGSSAPPHPDTAAAVSSAHEPDAASLAKTCALLFLPLAFLPRLLSAAGVSMRTLRFHRGLYYWLFRGFPAFDHVGGDNSGLAALWAVLFLALAGFHLVARRWRKPYLAALACAYAAYALGPGYLTAFLAAAALTWLGVLRLRRAPLRALCVAAGLGLLLIETRLAPLGPLERHLAELSCLVLALRAYSLASDVETAGAPGAVDFLLYLLGGFPALLGPPYPTYDGFSRSYLPRPYWQVARGGIVRIYLGLLKFACVYIVQMHLLPPGLRAVDYADPHASSGKLWAAAAVRLLCMLMTLVGNNQLAFGLGRLFGYELADNYVHPWFSWSPLDYWNRKGTWNIRYLKKYVYFPLLFRCQDFFWPLLATYSTTILFNSLFLVGLPVGPDRVPMFTVVFAQFALVSAIEIAWRRRQSEAAAPRPPQGWKRAVAVAGMLALLMLLHAPEPALFNIARPSAGAPTATFARRYLLLYGKLLFLR